MVPTWGLNIELGTSCFDCLDLGIFNKPKKNSKFTQFVQGFQRR